MAHRCYIDDAIIITYIAAETERLVSSSKKTFVEIYGLHHKDQIGQPTTILRHAVLRFEFPRYVAKA
ncbi:unnamed protein product [Echinostoma caproni]|uniref:Reverse transcriptase domain-containing protein n=1 Tax=Echinostoma caproni TaxID=27848 RepID=A0A183A6D8_9TREM|nr:unnamed protein product [Echinostoma caproni]